MFSIRLIEAYTQGERYVIVAATPVQFPETVETIIVPQTTEIIYFSI